MTNPNAFTWRADARVFVNARALGPEDQALWAMKQAVQSGRDFRIAPSKGAARVSELPRDVDGVPRMECATGGTTSTPKIIRRTQRSWINSFDVSQNLFGLGPNDHVATLGDLGHSLTLYATLEAVHLGAALTAVTKSNPRAQAVALENATVLYATPTLLRLLTTVQTALPKVRLILSGGGKLPVDTRKKVERMCPNADLREFYGAAETSFISLTDSDTPAESVGRPYPGVNIEQRSNGGELWVKSPYLFDGYTRGATDQTQMNDGWMTVGELGHLDDQGNLFLDGRKSRMFTVLDKNIFPEKIEGAVAAIPDVTHCAALPNPDPARGNEVVLIVEGSDGDTILRHCRALLAPHEVPRKILFTKEFPILKSGKPDFRALEELLRGAA